MTVHNYVTAEDFDPDPSHLEFESLSLKEFEEKFNADQFFLEMASDLLLPMQFSNEHEKGPWLAGGFFTRAAQGERFENYSGDVDIFFHSPEQKQGYMQGLNSGAFGLDVKPNTELTSSYSYTYQLNYKGKAFKLQLISYRTFHSIKALLSRFDMYSCMFGTDGINIFYEKNNTVECALGKQMKFNWGYLNETTAHPDARYLLKRYTKFIRNGYKITDQELHAFTELVKKTPSRQFAEGDGGGYMHV